MITPDNDDLKRALRADLDRAALTSRELDADLALVLENRPRRRSLLLTIAVPSALAVAAVAAFVVMSAPPAEPARAAREDAVEIYIGDADDPDSAIIIDITVLPSNDKGVSP